MTICLKSLANLLVRFYKTQDAIYEETTNRQVLTMVRSEHVPTLHSMMQLEFSFHSPLPDTSSSKESIYLVTISAARLTILYSSNSQPIILEMKND